MGGDFQSGRSRSLRFLTIDASRIMSPNVARNDPPPTQPTQACVVATPGPGFRVSGGTYVITREAFDVNTDVEGAIRAAFGNGATIADWQTLKGLLSTPTQLTKFFDEVGIPNQPINGPCDNFLVSNGGSYRLANGYWLFIARHDGRVPDNWAVLDSIGNHTLDLGRWTHKSQALVFVRDNPGEPSTSSQAQTPGKAADEREAKSQADLKAARDAVQQAEQERKSAEDAAARAQKELEQQRLAAADAERQGKLEAARREAEDARREAADAEQKLNAANAALTAEQARKTLESEQIKMRLVYEVVGGFIILLVFIWAFVALTAKRSKRFSSELGTSKRVNKS